MKYYVEEGSGYEFGIDGDNVFITKSPKSSVSRNNPKKVKRGSKAYNAIKKFVSASTSDKASDQKVQTKKTKVSDKKINQNEPQKDTTSKPSTNIQKEKEFKQKKVTSAYKKPQGLVKKEFSEFKELTWLDGDEDYIDAVEINGKDYFAIGYIQDTNTGKKGIAVKMTYSESRDLGRKSGKNISAIMAPMKTIKPSRGTHDMPFRKGKDVENYYLVPWGTPGVKIYVTMLNVLDGATIAAKLQNTLDVVGAIPVVGFVGDFANMTIELIKPKPSYFLATMYALGALPMLGEIIVIAKASKLIPKVAAKATANEAALQLAAKMSGDVDTFQKIGQTIRGKSFIKRLINYAEEFKKLLRGNFQKLERIGITISEEAIENFIKYFDEFVKAYKVYIKLTPIVAINKFKNLVAVAQRPAMYIGNQTVGVALEKEVARLDLYKITNVKKTDNVFSDSVKIARALSSNMEDVNPKTAEAIIAFADYLESSSFQSFLDTSPKNTAIAESNYETIINEENLRVLVRNLL